MLGVIVAAGCAVTKDAMDTPLGPSGDVARGREAFVSRDGGHCVICHAAPGVTQSGNIGPSMAGVGARLSPGQIRLRVADITRVNPDAAMPAFHRTENLSRVAPSYTQRPILSGAQVEDIVAWLSSLK